MTFRIPTVNLATLVVMAIDANFPVLFVAAYGIRFHRNPVNVFVDHPWLLLLALAFPAAFATADLYNLRRAWWSPRLSFRILAPTLAVAALFGLAWSLVGDTRVLRGLFAFVAAGMAAEVFLVRSLAAWQVRRDLRLRTAVVVGGGWSGRSVIDTTLREPRLRVRVAGLIDDDLAKRNFQYKGVPVCGTSQALRETVERHDADLIVVAISYVQNTELISALLGLKMSGVEVVDMPGFIERATGQIPIKHVEGSWFLYSGGFELLHQPLRQRFKRLSDIVVSAAGLALSLPLMGIVAALVKLDSRGPVFFRQERTGQGEKPFQLIKFRSMREDAEKMSGPVWASARDYRITRVGRLLRLTRLDEIPQFINVLRGDMSFIGPRPERPFFVEKLKKEIPYYSLRFAVKPGLTGWAQVQFRYGASVEDSMEKLKYDLYYVKNMSATLDLWILFKTLKVVLFAQGH